jgi:hypothetical protein
MTIPISTKLHCLKLKSGGGKGRLASYITLSSLYNLQLLESASSYHFLKVEGLLETTKHVGILGIICFQLLFF